MAWQPRQTERVDDSLFPPGFFDRADASPDSAFYSWPRLVTHLDDDAIAAVGALYDELGISGDVLDLMSSWVSHFRTPPARLTALGMNSDELDANPSAAVTVVHDLNAEPRLPFPDESFDAVVCCVSVDYLTRPIEVFTDAARCCAQEDRSSVRSPIDAFRPRLSAAGCTPTTSDAARSSNSTSVSLDAGMSLAANDVLRPRITAIPCSPCGPARPTPKEAGPDQGLTLSPERRKGPVNTVMPSTPPTRHADGLAG